MIFSLDETKLISDFVLNPDQYYIPSYRISPFQTKDIGQNARLPHSANIDEHLGQKFPGKDFIYTTHGKEAIRIALECLELKSEDCVTIFTTTSNFYISGCVTQEIEAICCWSRRIEPSTKVLFVNHEFGFPYEGLAGLKKYNLPIIEDCAHSFNSDNDEKSVGKVGDFVVYSFPKYFPVQIGGMLAFDPKYRIESPIDNSLRGYLQKVLSSYQDRIEDFGRKRRENHETLAGMFGTLGLNPRFELKDCHVPGIFMFETPEGLNIDRFRKFVRANGIESSAFYGEDAFFIPVHQNLGRADLEYFFEVVKDFFLPSWRRDRGEVVPYKGEISNWGEC